MPEKPIPPDDLWQKIDNLVQVPTQNDEGLTLTELAERWQVPHRTVRSRVQRLVAEGALLAGWKTVVSGGVRRQVRVYCPRAE